MLRTLTEGSREFSIFLWLNMEQLPSHSGIHYIFYPTLALEFQGFRVWGKFVFRTLELTDTPNNLANQVKVGHALDQSCSVQSRGPERAHQNNEPSWRSSRTDRRLSRSFETINWLYLLFKCGIKTKTHFEWLLWHWSSLGQLILEPTRPNGLVGGKVPTDLVNISVKEATHMGFYYTVDHTVVTLLVAYLGSQVTAIRLKLMYMYISSTGARSSDELQTHLRGSVAGW